MKSFFAVQIHRHEAVPAVAGLFLSTASQSGLSFKKLDFLDTFTFGAVEFARFQADLINPWSALERLLASGRSVIGPGIHGQSTDAGYLVKLASGRTGSATYSKMQAAPRSLRTFRGTAVEHWERQFSVQA